VTAGDDEIKEGGRREEIRRLRGSSLLVACRSRAGRAPGPSPHAGDDEIKEGAGERRSGGSTRILLASSLLPPFFS
jgi:hypothetical protein